MRRGCFHMCATSLWAPRHLLGYNRPIATSQIHGSWRLLTGFWVCLSHSIREYGPRVPLDTLSPIAVRLPRIEFPRTGSPRATRHRRAPPLGASIVVTVRATVFSSPSYNTLTFDLLDDDHAPGIFYGLLSTKVSPFPRV